MDIIDKITNKIIDKLQQILEVYIVQKSELVRDFMVGLAEFITASIFWGWFLADAIMWELKTASLVCFIVGIIFTYMGIYSLCIVVYRFIYLENQRLKKKK